MGITENKRVVERAFERAAEGDMDGFFDAFAADVRWTNIGSTKFSGVYEGKEALIGELLGPLFEQLDGGIDATVDNVVAEGDYVVVQHRGRATTRDGTPYNNTYCHVFKIQGGKICEVTEYMDTELVTEVFGR